jgi:hypothetical protein
LTRTWIAWMKCKKRSHERLILKFCTIGWTFSGYAAIVWKRGFDIVFTMNR